MPHLNAMTPEPTPALRDKVILYITCGRQMLVFVHTAFPDAGIQVPAGSIEIGETPEQAARREAREETGLEALDLRAFLGEEIFDLAAVGGQGVQRRYYFWMTCPGQPPQRWRTYEWTPSDGSPAPIEFELYWVDFPEQVPELAGGQGALLDRLLAVFDAGSAGPGQ